MISISGIDDAEDRNQEPVIRSLSTIGSQPARDGIPGIPQCLRNSGYEASMDTPSLALGLWRCLGEARGTGPAGIGGASADAILRRARRTADAPLFRSLVMASQV
jgi:hypothetical protein